MEDKGGGGGSSIGRCGQDIVNTVAGLLVVKKLHVGL